MANWRIELRCGERNEQGVNILTPQATLQMTKARALNACKKYLKNDDIWLDPVPYIDYYIKTGERVVGKVKIVRI